MKSKTIILITLALCTFSAAETYMYAGDFLGLGVGGRILGMGGTGSTITDDGAALYWNPASIAMNSQAHITAMHCSAFDGLSIYDYLGGHLRMERWGLGAALLRLGVDDIILTHFDDPEDPDRRPVVDDTISWSENAIYTSAAYALNSELALGMNIKTIIQGGGEYSSLGFSPDLGMYYKPSGHWDLAVSLHDVGGFIDWNTGAHDNINMFARPAMRYSFALDEANKHILSLAGEADVWFVDYGSAAQVSSETLSADFRAGGEWRYSLFALRGGLDRGHPTAGAGINWEMFNADYAFISSGELGISHRVSAGIEF